MNERKVKITPSFVSIDKSYLLASGLCEIGIAGSTPKGHRVALELKGMPPYVVRQLANQCIDLIQQQRDRALRDVQYLRDAAAK